MIFADKIIEERKKNGWSQEELADMLCVFWQAAFAGILRSLINKDLNIQEERMELQRPDKRHEKEVMALRELLFERNESFDGCGGLEDVSDYDSWLDFSGRLKEKYGVYYVPSDLYLAI